MNPAIRTAAALGAVAAVAILALPLSAGAAEQRPELPGGPGAGSASGGSFRLGPEDYPPTAMYPSGSLSGWAGSSKSESPTIHADAPAPVVVDDDPLELAQVALGMVAGGALVGAAVSTRRHHVPSA